MTPTNSLSPADYTTSPIISMLVTLGRTVLKNPTKSKWMNLEEICTLCKTRGIPLEGKAPTPHEVEIPIATMFQHNDEICFGGINITGYLKRQGWDQVFVIGFFPEVRSTISHHGERNSDLKENHTKTQKTLARTVR
ncbi:MAG: hypothetical protein WCT12_19455 [Verrucomicrobiota bacterium]